MYLFVSEYEYTSLTLVPVFENVGPNQHRTEFIPCPAPSTPSHFVTDGNIIFQSYFFPGGMPPNYKSEFLTIIYRQN